MFNATFLFTLSGVEFYSNIVARCRPGGSGNAGTNGIFWTSILAYPWFVCGAHADGQPTGGLGGGAPADEPTGVLPIPQHHVLLCARWVHHVGGVEAEWCPHVPHLVRRRGLLLLLENVAPRHPAGPHCLGAGFDQVQHPRRHSRSVLFGGPSLRVALL